MPEIQLVLHSKLRGRLREEPFQRIFPFEVEFLAKIRPLVVESLDVVVAQDPTDAGGLESERDHPAQADFTAGQFGVLLFQVGQHAGFVQVCHCHELVFDRPAFAAR